MDEVFENELYDSDAQEKPIYYVCVGCGHIQDYGGECEMCCGWSMDEVV